MDTSYLYLEQEIVLVSDLVNILVQDRDNGLVSFSEYKPVIDMLVDLGEKILYTFSLFNRGEISREIMLKTHSDTTEIIFDVTLDDYVSEKISEHLVEILEIISDIISDEEIIDEVLLEMLYKTWCSARVKIKQK